MPLERKRIIVYISIMIALAASVGTNVYLATSNHQSGNNYSTTIVYPNGTRTSTTTPPPNIPLVYLTNVHSWGNKTCSGPTPLTSNGWTFTFNMTGTLTNADSRSNYNQVTVEILFQLDNATRQDSNYVIQAGQSINITSQVQMGYCQFTGKQDFEMVLIYSGLILQTIYVS